MRKASLLSNATGDPQSSNNVRRTNSGRAVRTNTTRPANYYARTYARQGPEATEDDSAPAGFFPALTFFTDAVTALPREVMRQFTLMKEVEAKVHGPNERLGEAVDALLEQPVPRRTNNAGGVHGGMLSFTAANSAIGSANVSLVNGVAPYGASGQNSAAASVNGEDTTTQDGEGDMERRKQYHELRMITHNLLANLDEKNVVLTEANRVLSLQMTRLDSVMPHVEEEIPEEARLGSMTHWAYSDNRLKVKPLPPAANERNRREVALTNHLAAAANAVHETEILAARRDATKDTGKEKTGRGRQQREQIDSEFEDRPKKTTAKVARGKAAAAAAAAAAASAAGLGISTPSEPVKRRKVDKVAGGTGMERQASSKGKAAKETPRSTPAAEPAKKVTKAKAAAPAPTKRKIVNSAQATLAVANSPLQATFSAAQVEAAAPVRPQSARMMKTSSTNLRHERVMDQADSRPTSSASKSNGEKSNGKKRAREEDELPTEAAEPAQNETVKETTMKREDVESSAQRPLPSRSNSSKKTSGRQSNNGTPRAEEPGSDTAMARTRSTRSMRGNGGETPGSETPNYPRANHKRSMHGGSMSGLMRQIAPFNRSPDHGRDEDDPDEDMESNSDNDARFRARSLRRSNTGSRNVSRQAISSSKRSGNSSRERGERRRRVEQHHVRQDDRDTEMANSTEDKNVVSSREPHVSPPPAPALTHSPSPSLSSHPPSPTQPSPAPQVQRPAPPIFPQEREPQAEPSAENDPDSSLPPSTAASPLATPVPDSPPRSHPTRGGETRASVRASEAQADEARAESASEDEDPDPDDPLEPKYCYCLRGSYGDMVGCDNPKCEREWFHLGCTDLEIMPGEEESWFCTLCRPRGGRGAGVGSRGGVRGGNGGRGKRGRGRGRGA
jgi:hypothetical protein